MVISLSYKFCQIFWKLPEKLYQVWLKFLSLLNPQPGYCERHPEFLFLVPRRVNKMEKHLCGRPVAFFRNPVKDELVVAMVKIPLAKAFSKVINVILPEPERLVYFKH